MTQPLRVLHVCTGNICRSPSAELLMRAGLVALAGPPVVATVDVRSAGTHAMVGDGLHHRSRQALEALTGAPLPVGADVQAFRAQQLDARLVRGADLVLTATRAHRAHVVTLVPEAHRWTFTLREFDRLLTRVPVLPGAPDVRTAGRDLVAAAVAARGSVRPDRPEDDDVEDPYGGGHDDYAACAALLAATLARPVARLAALVPGVPRASGGGAEG